MYQESTKWAMWEPSDCRDSKMPHCHAMPRGSRKLCDHHRGNLELYSTWEGHRETVPGDQCDSGPSMAPMSSSTHGSCFLGTAWSEMLNKNTTPILKLAQCSQEAVKEEKKAM